MNNVVPIVFTGIVTMISAFYATSLISNSNKMLGEIDQIQTQSSTCRSSYTEINDKKFRFSDRTRIYCPQRRTDYAAPGTGTNWPIAICTILKNTRTQILKEGTDPCAYL